MSNIISTGTILFSDDFSNDIQINSSAWSYVEYEASNNPAYLGQTETNQSLAQIDNGAAHLTVDTYLAPPGTGSFAGTAMYTTQSFQPGSTGIVITVTAKLDQTQGGLVGGIFLYNLLDQTTTDHNEIDNELVSNDLTSLSVNTYDNQPLGAGNPQTAPLPQTISLTQWNTFQIVWTSSEISWYIDGTQVASTTTNIPTGPMPVYLNFWVPGTGTNGWAYAYNSSLAPALSPADNTQYGFDISSVQVAQLVSCFAAGTHIATDQGSVAVEHLHVGDAVLTASGKCQPIRWIGHRTTNCLRHPDPARVWPIRITPHAFGNGRPARTLLLSPDHAVFIDDVLVPVKFLLNGSTITQVQAAHITYYHLELPRHDIVLAEGMPSESYLDTGGRHAFATGGNIIQLHADFTRDADRVAMIWESSGYAPLAADPRTLERIRNRLTAQAAMLPMASEPRLGLHRHVTRRIAGP